MKISPSYLIMLVVMAFVTLCRCNKSVILELNDYLQPDDADTYYNFAPTNDTKSCTRECVKDAPPRICYYKFIAEDYASLTTACEGCPNNVTDCYNPQCVATDGYERGLLTINRMIPGPSIQVCLGDRIIVDVQNSMLARTTSIHWHGVFQKGTLYSDGVPMVTQCPIASGNSFRYDFYANNSGTFYWHSHDGLQKLDGLQGNLVIRRPLELEPNRDLYDYDLPAHVMFINDWYHTGASQHFPGLVTHDTTTYAYYYLINGRGRFTNPHSGNSSKTPYSVFRVTSGKSYRFRIVGATCTQCSASVTFQNHSLTLIATDGVSVKPVVVDSLNIYSGERYDFVLNATQNIQSYWIQVRGLGQCFKTRPSQVAILQYEGSNEAEPQSMAPTYETYLQQGLTLNPINASCHNGENGICVSQLKTAEDFPQRILKSEADVNVVLTFGYHFPSVEEEFQSGTFHRYLQPEPNARIITWVNNIFMTESPMPILSQRNEIRNDAFCPNDTQTGFPTCKDNSKGYCDCFHVIRIPVNSVVQFILLDKSTLGGLDHPFHLHGYAYCVMGMGYLNESLQNEHDIVKLVETKKITDSQAPAFKDTIAVPSDGYSVVRIVTDNPGYWFFHCHFAHHLVDGMSVVIQVGDPENYPQVPDGFPKCGNYLPTKMTGWTLE